jgi:hypothetical protein
MKIMLTCCAVADIPPLNVLVSGGVDIHAQIPACDLLAAASLMGGNRGEDGTQSEESREFESRVTHVVGCSEMEMIVVDESRVSLMYDLRALQAVRQRT